MVSIGKICGSFEECIVELRQMLAEEATRRINAQLEAKVEARLHRGYHERCKGTRRRRGEAQCQRCGTRETRRSSRNGHRRCFPNWPRRFLRTISLLERVNRMIRRLFRAAGAFHSLAGLRAAVARVLEPHRLI